MKRDLRRENKFVEDVITTLEIIDFQCDDEISNKYKYMEFVETLRLGTIYTKEVQEILHDKLLTSVNFFIELLEIFTQISTTVDWQPLNLGTVYKNMGIKDTTFVKQMTTTAIVDKLITDVVACTIMYRNEINTRIKK